MGSPTTDTTMVCNQQTNSCRSSLRPSWLQATLTDIEQRLEALSLHRAGSAEDGASDSFAERAENYYRKRPQLISLVQELYNKYVYLADRYVQAILKPNGRSQSQVPLFPDDADTDSSDAESSLSFQTPAAAAGPAAESVANSVVAELVVRTIEGEMLRHEVGLLEKQQSESSRKMELQGSLLEVLESERMVLLTENARLGFKAAALKEDNDGLAAEVGFLRRKAGELARCVVKLRDDHRVCMLGRKIEALQAQIYGLEKRNRECHDLMVRTEEEKTDIVRGLCSELERLKAENRDLTDQALAAAAAAAGRGKKHGGWRTLRGFVLCAGKN